VQAISLKGLPENQTVPDSAAELARDLIAVASHVFKHSGPEYYGLIDELELSVTQMKTLHCLTQADWQGSVKEVAEQVGTSLAATSRNVEALQKRGLLERREDDQDRRVKRVRLTAAGHDTVNRLSRARLAGMEAFAASLTEAQRTRLRGALAFLMDREDIGSCRPAHDLRSEL
jgi:DNA-binding MarR family transcriptional regulator